MEAITIILVMHSNLYNLLDLFMVASDISTFAFFVLAITVLININLMSSKCKGGKTQLRLHCFKVSVLEFKL